MIEIRTSLSEREKLLVMYGEITGVIKNLYGIELEGIVTTFNIEKESIRTKLNMTDYEILSCKGCSSCDEQSEEKT